MPRAGSLALMLVCAHLATWPQVSAIHPDCAIVAQLRKAHELCVQARRQETRNRSRAPAAGCRTEWDEIHCWYRAEVGQVVNVSCTEVSQLFVNSQGHVFRNCTERGWSDLYPPYEAACHFQEEEETETTYYSTFRKVYTAGYATSLLSLITAIFVFTTFRKFHCTRNYIHMNLFASFILRASAVFIKDGVLFTDETLNHCFVSTPSCKAAVAFFHFSILANYFWLLVEGMYLQTLLILTFVSQKKYFWWYILVGWGLPVLALIIWVLTRNFYDNRGCWDDTDYAVFWWIIKGPITASLLVNFVIFINVIRILVQKLKSPGMSGCDTSPFMRLAKSTLFLIPLFGMHYTLFAFLPETTGESARLYIELGLGSFQGFVVALLYCFLNGEVQAEMKKRLCKWQTQSYMSFAKRRRAFFTESSTVTQISVLEKTSPREYQSITVTQASILEKTTTEEEQNQTSILEKPTSEEEQNQTSILEKTTTEEEQNQTSILEKTTTEEEQNQTSILEKTTTEEEQNQTSILVKTTTEEEQNQTSILEKLTIEAEQNQTSILEKPTTEVEQNQIPSLEKLSPNENSTLTQVSVQETPRTKHSEKTITKKTVPKEYQNLNVTQIFVMEKPGPTDNQNNSLIDVLLQEKHQNVPSMSFLDIHGFQEN